MQLRAISACTLELQKKKKKKKNTKAIALVFGQNWPILGTFHSKIKISKNDFWSKLGKIPRL